MQRFEGKVAVVTGGASGIGAATAKRLVAEGARVVVADQSTEQGEAVASALRAGGARAEFHACDVGDLGQVEALMHGAVERFGGLDVVFNNAGIGAYGKTPDLDPDDWHRTVRVNLDSVFYGCRAAIPHLRRRGGGAIVNTASISGLGGDYGLTVYNATKGAVCNYTRSLAIDHARENIRVNAVCPGCIETGLTVPLYSSPPLRERFEQAIPMGRIGLADEIATAVAFLASDDASYVTGALLVVDGGLTAHTGAPNYTRIMEG